MDQPVEVTRAEHSSGALRQIASRLRDGRGVRRLLAIALVLDGQSRAEAAAACGMDRQILRDWLLRDNARGVAGLSNQPIPGRPPHLSDAQMAELKQGALDGPDLDRHGVMRWRCVDLQREIKQRFKISAHVATAGKWLGTLNLTRLQARPAHPGKDADDEAAFKNTSATLSAAPWPRDTAARPERSGSKMVEGRRPSAASVSQGTLGAVWARLAKGSGRRSRMQWQGEGERGSCPVAERDCRRDRAYVFGAVRPARAAGEALIMPSVNIEAMTLHLRQISARVVPGAHAALVLDGAAWHRTGGALAVPDTATLVRLAPYSPELNPLGKRPGIPARQHAEHNGLGEL